MIKTPEEILKEVANDHSYNTWGEAMYDTHPHTQVEYAVEAMQAYHSQFPSPQEVTDESIECIRCDGKGWQDEVPCRPCDMTGRMTAKRWREWDKEIEDEMDEMRAKHESDDLPF